jgi:hypothetical protein
MYESETSLLRPMIESSAKKYAGEKGLQPRDCAKAS